MKKNHISLPFFPVALMLFVALPLAMHGQGIEFFHGSFETAKTKAKSEDKLIFVDAYAEWCGPCKRMAAQTFPDPKAGEFFNANFVCLKIDMEKPENAEFASKYPVSAYPTLMVLNADGTLAGKQTGALGVEQLLDFGRKVLGKADKSGELQAEYDAGKRDPEFMLTYVKALNRAGKPSLKITNEYLNTQKDYSTPFNQRFILEGAIEADSRVFDLLIEQRSGIEKLEGEQTVKNRIEKACQNTVKKAIEYKDEKLLEEAKAKMKAHHPDRYTVFANEADTRFSSATKDSKAYLKVMKKRQKEVDGNAARTHDLVVEMIRAFPTDAKVLKQAEKWAAAAAKSGGLPDYYLTLGRVYKNMGNKPKARAAADQARKAADEKDPIIGQKIEIFLNDLD